ncbi:hypothetical protein KIH79_09175 [Bifidobacterium sp. 82T10]|uniref:Uncharacterized protein n=1 Tax=Bifidobacterium miconis TaxID=2834435 RepID=A0ABS6WGA9_9BIFI|nr:hypothetical protein [Bifidobacterium miconis]MBW3093088.1 hypothetical protein [Bifidobacterium miconis]
MSASLTEGGVKAMSAYKKLAKLKHDTAVTLLESDDLKQLMDGMDLFNRIELAWRLRVGDHVNDMHCAILMHGLHTRDRQQVRTALEIIAGTHRPDKPAKPVGCQQCGYPVKPGNTLCYYCRTGHARPWSKRKHIQ